eukprot:2792004-Amphidinium_carterae.1
MYPSHFKAAIFRGGVVVFDQSHICAHSVLMTQPVGCCILLSSNGGSGRVGESFATCFGFSGLLELTAKLHRNVLEECGVSLAAGANTIDNSAAELALSSWDWRSLSFELSVADQKLQNDVC